MGLRKGALFLGFDRSGVSGGRVRAGLRGSRLEACSWNPLPSGALEPSPFDSNIRAADVVSEAVTAVVSRLEFRQPITLVLPDGVARAALFEVPRGVARDDFVRFRLTQGLPYPPEEAIVGVLDVASGRVLGGVVRRRVVAEYESIVRAAGHGVAGVELAAFTALSALGSTREPGPTVELVLGDCALTLAAADGAGVRFFRNRRRVPGGADIDWIEREVLVAAAQLAAERPKVRIVGRGSTGIIAELSLRGHLAEAGWTTPQEALPLSPVEFVWSEAGA